MKISYEEVNRLLAMPPQERGYRQSVATPDAPRNVFAGREAARVEVSATAQEVQQVKRMVNQLPETREDRVQALKQQIENGTYNVSGEDIADLIIRRVLADNSAL